MVEKLNGEAELAFTQQKTEGQAIADTTTVWLWCEHGAESH